VTDSADERNGLDRRRAPRGGRRLSDRAGFAPGIMLIDHRTHRRHRCAGRLRRARFAVVPFASIPRAVATMAAWLPEAIVVSAKQVDSMTAYVTASPHVVPVVLLVDRGETLVDSLRITLRRLRA